MSERLSDVKAAGDAGLAAGGGASVGRSCRPGVGAWRAFECVASRACCVVLPFLAPTPAPRAPALACGFPGLGLPMERGR